MVLQNFTHELQADRLCHTSNSATAVGIAHFNCPSITQKESVKVQEKHVFRFMFLCCLLHDYA